MNERIKERLRQLDIHVIPWVDEWDALAAQWFVESEPELEGTELNQALVVGWFRSLKAQPQNTIYAITSKGSPVGVGGVLNQNPITRSAELHLLLDGSVRGKGVGRMVSHNTIKTLFENGFQRLSVAPSPSNIAAMNMAVRLGFKKSDRIVLMELTKDKWLLSKDPLSDDTKLGEHTACHF